MRVMVGGLLAVLLNPTPALDAQAPPVRAWLGSEALLPVATYRLIPSIAVVDPAPVHGAVELEVVVDVAGRVAHARVVTHLTEAFDRASLEAIRRWRFRPAQRGGRPVSLIGVRFMFLPPKAPGAASEVNAMVGVLPRRPLPPPASPLDAYPATGTPGLAAPRTVRTVTPEYTDAGLRRKIQGDVELEVVVTPDGRVASTRVVRSLDAASGLDEQALIAARYWLFEPATLDGRPVAVTATLILQFGLY